MAACNLDGFERILLRSITILEPLGFETYPFKIGWYNEQVLPVFQFDMDSDALALIIISTPHMFEKAFKPFVYRKHCTGIKDPIDECIATQFEVVKQAFPEHNMEAIHDFEVNPANRRPRVLVQTAAHVAGAAYYYQRSDVTNDPWDKKQHIYGVSVHPQYGGWFAMRGVLIFRHVTCPDLPKKEPSDCLPTDEQKIKLLEGYNFNWKDWKFRDIIYVNDENKYSEEQKKYFETPPSERFTLLGISKS